MNTRTPSHTQSARKREKLWGRTRDDHKSYHMTAYDWGKEIMALEAELKVVQRVANSA